jgi:hypothetical protein
LQYDKDHKSLATVITQERIKTLNRKMKRKITMEIIDLKDEQWRSERDKGGVWGAGVSLVIKVLVNSSFA